PVTKLAKVIGGQRGQGGTEAHGCLVAACPTTKKGVGGVRRSREGPLPCSDPPCLGLGELAALAGPCQAHALRGLHEPVGARGGPPWARPPPCPIQHTASWWAAPGRDANAGGGGPGRSGGRPVGPGTDHPTHHRPGGPVWRQAGACATVSGRPPPP